MYRKKMVDVEARQLTGGNHSEITAWVTANGGVAGQGAAPSGEPCLYLETPEGLMRVNNDDWVIRGVQGEFYLCKPDVFGETYDYVSDDPRDQAIDTIARDVIAAHWSYRPTGYDLGSVNKADFAGIRRRASEVVESMDPGASAAAAAFDYLIEGGADDA